MKANTFFILILFLPLMSMAIDHYHDGDTLHVLATSGLNMRNASTLKSDKLTKVPYGEKVVVLNDGFESVPFSVTETGDILIEGYWVYVSYKDTFGYVFDGYLSHIPAPDISYEVDEAGEYLEHYQHFLNEKLGKYGQPVDVYFYENENPPTPCRWTQMYRYGVHYTEYGCEESSGFNARLDFVNASFEEVYLIYKTLFFRDKKDKIDKQYNGNIEIGPEDGGAGCYYTLIKSEMGEYHIQIYCGC